MNGSMLTAVALVLAVLIGAWLLRRMSSGSDSAPDAGSSREDVDRMLKEALERGGADEDDDEDSEEVVALTSDGWAFVPDGEEVQLIPPGDEDDLPVRSGSATGLAPSDDPLSQATGGRGAPVNPKTGRRVSGWKPGTHLDVGDLIAARVKRGAPDYDPWRLEALGREREFRAWRFETEEAARAAYDLVNQRIVRPPRDPDGDVVRITDADFESARCLEEETEAELANEFGDEEPRGDELR